MGQIVICLLIVQKFINLKQKILKLQQVHYVQEIFQEIGQQVICMKRTWFNGYVYDFSLDYDATDVDDTVDIYKYLMKNNNIV